MFTNMITLPLLGGTIIPRASLAEIRIANFSASDAPLHPELAGFFADSANADAVTYSAKPLPRQSTGFKIPSIRADLISLFRYRYVCRFAMLLVRQDAN